MIEGLTRLGRPASELELLPPLHADISPKIKRPVYLVGQKNLALEGLRTLLLRHDIFVEGVATTFRDLDLPPALEAEKLLIIFDVNDEIGRRGEELMSCRLRFPRACIIVLLNHFRKSLTALPSELHVNAILDRNIACDALMRTLNVALAGYAVLSHVGEAETPERPPVARSVTVKSPGLSDREAEIIECIAEGHSNKVIARRFSISEATVKIHVRGILRKVDARNRTQAAVWALRTRSDARAGSLVDKT
jgi:two-component system, NarL family, nitrate/nitrite response regulator NarL